ncbi:adenylate kinase-domain-containing protein [Pavlovales sp. CCMP2436]|nr:adenylate kinase-domain-containing protein [Pavlovales sp. CCMP2436]
MRRVILLGAPGVGKGTYAKRLAPLFGLEHVVVGDIVRGHVKRGSDVGKAVAEATRRGDLVDDEIIMSLLLDHLKSRGLEDGGYMLDGVPRTVGQAQTVDALLRPDLALHLTMEEDIMLEKMIARRGGPDNSVLNIAYIKRSGWNMPPLLAAPTRWDEKTQTLFCEHGTALVPNENVQCALCTHGRTVHAHPSEPAAGLGQGARGVRRAGGDGEHALRPMGDCRGGGPSYIFSNSWELVFGLEVTQGPGGRPGLGE